MLTGLCLIEDQTFDKQESWLGRGWRGEEYTVAGCSANKPKRLSPDPKSRTRTASPLRNDTDAPTTMARRVEESDDDLPELADLLRKPRSQASTCKKAPASTGSDRAANELQESRSHKTKAHSSFGETVDAEREGAKKQRPKKRVLIRTCDNPLLRPISSTDRSGGSANHLGEASNPKARARIQKENKSDGTLLVNVSRHVTEGRFDEDEPSEDLVSNPRKATVSRGVESRKAAKKSRSKPEQVHVSDGESLGYGSDGLSEFIVSDSTALGDDPVIEAPPSRSGRRLVRGRRPTKGGESDEEDRHDVLDLRMKQLRIYEGFEKSNCDLIAKQLEDFAGAYSGHEIHRGTTRSSKKLEETACSDPETQNVYRNKQESLPISDLDEPFILRL